MIRLHHGACEGARVELRRCGLSDAITIERVLLRGEGECHRDAPRTLLRAQLLEHCLRNPLLLLLGRRRVRPEQRRAVDRYLDLNHLGIYRFLWGMGDRGAGGIGGEEDREHTE